MDSELDPEYDLDETPDLASMTIAQLKAYASERGFNDLFRNGTKKADYIAWIEGEIRSVASRKKTAKHFENAKNMIIEANARKAKVREQYNTLQNQKAAVQAKINEYKAIPDKTPAQYDKLVACLETMISINDCIYKASQFM